MLAEDFSPLPSPDPHLAEAWGRRGTSAECKSTHRQPGSGSAIINPGGVTGCGGEKSGEELSEKVTSAGRLRCACAPCGAGRAQKRLQRPLLTSCSH